MSIDALTVADRIYEAALVPELWSTALDGIAALSGSASGAVYIHRAGLDAWAVGTPRVAGVLADVLRDKDFYSRTPRIARNVARAHEARFLQVAEVLSAQEMEDDPAQHLLRGAGLEAQTASNVLLPSGYLACFTFERAIGQGPHSSQQVQALDRMRPHLARASVMAMHQSLERAQTLVAALQAVGLPAAALAGDGCVLACNAAFEDTPALRPAAFGQLGFESPEVQALFQQALLQAAAGPAQTMTRSIPVPAARNVATSTPLVLHLIPVRGAAHDIFVRTVHLLVATPFGHTTALPDLSLLHGLFDLTPREAQLAMALAEGLSLRDAAARHGIQYSTARTHLERIFHKTGVRQQTQLVLLLQGARRLGDDRAPGQVPAAPVPRSRTASQFTGRGT